MATLNTLTTLFKRELNKLKEEIGKYDDPADLWKTSGAISNSAGNLCLHLCGNLKHFIGAELGHSGFVRDRPAEFGDKDIPVVQLIQNIDETTSVVLETLSEMNEDQLNEPYTATATWGDVTKGFALIHLYGHLDYHLGQINYHRRLIGIA